jgi:hypothetical protein
MGDARMRDKPMPLEINGYSLFLTCSACPEQYDVFKEDKQLGYLRLRHGGFTVTVPDVGGETIYCASPQGEGEFQDLERIHFLRIAIDYIDDHLKMDCQCEECIKNDR